MGPDLAGREKQGKSVYVIEMGLCIAEGRNFLGFTVPQPRKVLYYQQEISLSVMQERMSKILPSCTGLWRENFLLKNTTGFTLKLTDKTRRDREKVCREIEEFEPELVAFDPLTTFHNKRGNDEGDMTELMDFSSYLAQTYEIGVWWNHHYGKPTLAGREGAQLLRGHSVISDRPDTIINFNRIPARYAGTRLALPFQNYTELAFTLRNDAAPDNLIIERDPISLWYRESNLYTEMGRVILPERIRHRVQQEGGEIMQSSLMEELEEGASRRLVLDAIAEAEEKNYITRERAPGRGAPFLIKLVQPQTQVEDADADIGVSE